MKLHRYCEHCKVNIDNLTKNMCECGNLVVSPITTHVNVSSLNVRTPRDDEIKDLKSALDTVRNVVIALGGRNPQLIRTDRRTELIATVLSVRSDFKERTIDRVAREVKPLFVDLFPKYFQDDILLTTKQEKIHREVYANE